MTIKPPPKREREELGEAIAYHLEFERMMNEGTLMAYIFEDPIRYFEQAMFVHKVYQRDPELFHELEKQIKMRNGTLH